MTFIDVLRKHASSRPDDPAFLFIEDGETVERRISYAELLNDASALATRLAETGASGDRIIILCAPGIDYIAGVFACFLSGRVAVPLYPPETTRLARSLERIAAVVTDSGARMVLVDRLIGSMADSVCAASPILASLEWITVARSATPSSAGQLAEVSPSSAALLQYTSGSTGVPNGVILTHANLMADAENLLPYFGPPTGAAVGWLPPYHDMGLMGMLLQPFFMGMPSISISPLHFLQRPARWLRLVSKYRGTVMIAPNFAYDLCVRKAEPDALDLRCLRAVLNGAEPIRGTTLRSFRDKFAPFGFDEQTFVPCYGLAEGTLIVSGRLPSTGFSAERVSVPAMEEEGVARAPKDGEQERELISAGRAAGSNEVSIVDPETCLPVPARHIGEIWVKGPNVSAGYHTRNENNAHTFRSDGAGVTLRTGDLGFLREDGDLFVAGRRKDVIIIRGRNLYPHDVEQAVERAHPDVRKGCVAAFGMEHNGEEGIGVVLEAGTKGAPLPSVDAIHAAVMTAIVLECGVPPAAVVVIEPGSLPKTSSGKLRRRDTRAAYLKGGLREIGQSK